MRKIVKEKDFSAEICWYLMKSHARNNIQIPINQKQALLGIIVINSYCKYNNN